MLQFKKVAFYTLGCKLNFSETSTIARQLTDAGCARVSFDDDPDVFVINTCSVTDNADKKCRSIVRRSPDLKTFHLRGRFFRASEKEEKKKYGTQSHGLR